MCSPLAAADRRDRYNATLADILSAPNSVERIRRLVERGAETPTSDAVLRSLLQGRGGGVEAR